MSIDSGLVGDSILSRAAYGGDGYGFGRGRGGANFEFDGSVVNAKLESNKEANTVQHHNILSQIDSAADRARDAASRAIADQHFTSLTDKLNDNQAKTDTGLATIIANQSADVRVSDAVSNAQQNAKLDAILAENGRGHGGRG